jgi:DNA repair exonuclease SbcCD ATPase subunit
VLVRDIAASEGERDKKRGRVENLQGRSARAEEEIRAYEIEVLNLERAIARLLEEDRKLHRLFTEAEMRYCEAEEQKKQLQEKIESLHSVEIQLRTELERNMAKEEFLRGLDRKPRRSGRRCQVPCDDRGMDECADRHGGGCGGAAERNSGGNNALGDLGGWLSFNLPARFYVR